MAIHDQSKYAIAKGNYVLTPNKDIFFSKELALKHCIVPLSNGETFVRVVNIGHSPQILPKGAFVATTTLLDTASVCAHHIYA